MPSGGGETGGTVVQQTDPYAALTVGQMGNQAAYQASQLAQQQSYNALGQLQQSYANQLQSLQPTTEEGIQAMDQLNQLLGLQAYTPSTAPTAPQTPAQYAASQITPSMINQYINANTAMAIGNPSDANNAITGSRGGGAIYSGVGAPTGSTDTNNSQAAGFFDTTGVAGNEAGFIQKVDPSITGAVTNYLTNQLAQQDQANYNAQQQAYNQQMGLYNYANQQAQNYQPLTPDQISQKLAATPGYQWNLSQGENAIQNAASKSGNAFSGNMLSGLMQYANGLAQQTYGTQVQNLANLVNAGNQANAASANAAGNLGTNSANVYNNLGSTQANSTLSGANSIMQGLLSANQEYNIIGQQSTGSNLGGVGSLLGGVLGSPATGGGTIGGSIVNGLFSSKELKDVVESPSTEEILERVKELQIDKWVYKNLDEAHIGPYAEDFKEKFGVGDGKSINIIDALGVLFAAVQALTAKVEAGK